jgi:uncharacterized protein YbjQ (UPF0145 family)
LSRMSRGLNFAFERGAEGSGGLDAPHGRARSGDILTHAASTPCAHFTNEGGPVPMLITTTETVPGYVIERVLGLVEAGSWWSFRGGRRRVARIAQSMGANAIVGAGYAGSPGLLSSSLFYGTAVVVRPETSP